MNFGNRLLPNLQRLLEIAKGIIYITSQILKICLFPKIQYLPLTKNSIRLFNGRVLKVPLVGYLLNTAPWGFGKMESKEVLVE